METSLISIMVTALVMLATACGPAQTLTTAPPTTAPTQAFTLATSIKDIVGTWRNEGAGLYIRFDGLNTSGLRSKTANLNS